jgi:peptidoglycan/xylan/chitin deacetylase (PgdA/CDA1 family)
MKATFFVTTSYIDGKSRKEWSGGRAREYMSWDDVKALNDMGFEIGSHMVSHVGLGSLGDEDLGLQLKGSRDAIARVTGKPVNVLSYPYGSVNERVVQAAIKAGFRGACSSFTGVNSPSTNPYLLRRTEIDGYDTINDFRGKLNGLYD